MLTTVLIYYLYYNFHPRLTCICDGSQFFNKEFSSRCIDKSDKSIVLANAEWSVLKDAKIKVYRDGIARLTKGWKVFAETIGIRANDACLFSVRRFPRGLNATVFITRL